MNDSGRAGRVLIVDDDPPVRAIMHATLAVEGHSVVDVSDGAQALEAARKERFDAIVLDLDMPGIDGYEVIERLNEMPATKDVPVVVVTGIDDAWGRLREARGGVFGHVPKPFSSNELVTIVDSAIRCTPDELAARRQALAQSAELFEETAHLTREARRGDAVKRGRWIFRRR